MHGPPDPQPGAITATMVCSSAIVGKRQSQWPAKPSRAGPPAVGVQFALVTGPAFKVGRKAVKAVPSAILPLLLQLYRAAAQCGQPLPSTFFSHWSPVALSVIVPSALSTRETRLAHLPRQVKNAARHWAIGCGLVQFFAHAAKAAVVSAK